MTPRLAGKRAHPPYARSCASAEQQVAGRRGQPHRQPVELLGDDDLAAEPGRLAEVEGEVEHVLFVLARLLEQIVPVGIDDHVTGRAGERPFARPLDIDVMAMSDFEHRQAERCVNLAAGAVAFDKDHFRHQVKSAPGAVSTSGRGAKSSARRAAASAIATSDCNSAAAASRKTASPAASAAPVSRTPAALSGASPSAITAWVAGRASARSARTRAPANRSSHWSAGASMAGAASTCSKPSRSASTTALPPIEIATSTSMPLASMPIAAPAAPGSAGPPSGSSI